MDWIGRNLGLVGGVAVGVVVLIVAWRAFSPKKQVVGDDMKLNVVCKGCGWKGIVTKYNQVCRKCNSRDLERF